jgi:4-oxalocrotonate tautomerase
MPVITVETWPLKEEQKPEIIKNITKVFTDMKIPAQAVTVILHETKHENWGSEGEQHSIKFKEIIEKL